MGIRKFDSVRSDKQEVLLLGLLATRRPHVPAYVACESLTSRNSRPLLICVNHVQVVDLDKETFEVYKGKWDKFSGQSRFGAAEDVKESAAGPIDIASWRLSELPDEAAFLQACTVSDDEEGSNNGADDNAEVAANV